MAKPVETIVLATILGLCRPLRRIPMATGLGLFLSLSVVFFPFSPVIPKVQAAVAAIDVGGDGNSRVEGMSVNRTCPWDSKLSIDVRVPLARHSFLYASPCWPIGWFRFFSSVDSFFLYYGKDVHDEVCEKLDLLHVENRTVYAVLDPDLPGNRTLLDLYYDFEMREAFTKELIDVIYNLTLAGLDGFVLGDEWPRGCQTRMITVQMIGAYNETYHQETGRWMRPDGGERVEKAQLAEWFYHRSIQVWNAIAKRIRGVFPDIVLGTNVDLYWKPNYGSGELAMWRSSHWVRELDIDPYDFIVCHYYTSMPRTVMPDEVDVSSLKILDSSIDSMRAFTQGSKDLYIMLAAQYNEPFVISPAQMLAEWNHLAERNVSAIGWFAFDSWETGIFTRWRENGYLGCRPRHDDRFEWIYLPFRIERTLMVRVLSSAREEAISEKEALQISDLCDPSTTIESPYLEMDGEDMVLSTYSPSGRYLMMVAQTQIQIRDVKETFRTLRTIHARGGLFVWADWSPDEMYLACTTTDGQLVISETGITARGNTTEGDWIGRESRHLLGLGPLGRVDWAPKGGVIACEASGGVVLFKASAPDLDPSAHWLVGPDDLGYGLCGWSSDGNHIAISSPGFVELWRMVDIVEATRVVQLPTVSTHRVVGSWSPKGSLLAVVTGSLGREDILVYDAAENTTMARVGGIRSAQRPFYIVVGNVDNVVTGESERSGVALSRITSLAWDAEGNAVIAGMEDGHICGVDLRDSKVLSLSIPMILFSEYLLHQSYRFDWLPADCCHSTWPEDHVWPERYVPLTRVTSPSVLFLSFSPLEADVIAVTRPDGISFVNLTSARRREGRFIISETRITISVEEVLIGVGSSKQVHLSDTGTNGQVLAMDWSDNEDMLAVAFGEPEDSIKIWKVGQDGSSELVAHLWDVEKPVDLSFSPAGGVLAFSTENGSVKLWRLEDGHITTIDEVPAGLFGGPSAVSYSPDGMWLAITTSEGGGETWLINVSNPLSRVFVKVDALWSTWSLDGALLAVGSSTGIEIWSLENMEDLHPMRLSHCDTGAAVRRLEWCQFGEKELLIAAIETGRDGLTEIDVFEWTGFDLVPRCRRTVAYRLDDGSKHVIAWSAGSDLVAFAVGLEEYKDPWREEWIREVVLGSVCLSEEGYWFEELRPKVLLLDGECLESNIWHSYPTQTDAVSAVECLGASGLIATGSIDGRVLLWDLSRSIHIDELRAQSMIGIVPMGMCLLGLCILRLMQDPEYRRP